MATITHIRRRGAGRATLVLVLLSMLSLPAARTFAEPLGVEVDEGLAPRPAWESAPTVEATFLRDSYAPGSTATLVLWKPERHVAIQIFRAGTERQATVGNVTMNGVAVTPPQTVDGRRAHAPIAVRVGDWPSGFYFARLRARDGRVGFAPFVVRPRLLGAHRVLVVLPTYTWQAYNFRDDDGDGRGDTWYAGWRQNWARLARPFLARGIPPHFRRYDLPFLRWLAQTGRHVDVFSDGDLDAVSSGAALADAYDLIVFPGHHEYVTTREYDVVEAFRNRGGNLLFLSANNFFWRVVVHEGVMTRTRQWRDLGRPEASLVGVQYIGTDGGHHRAPWLVHDTQTARALFSGVRLGEGRSFGNGGIEIDHTAPSSPPGIEVVAEIPHLFGERFTGQMTYYETPGGAKVFAAGAFRLVDTPRRPSLRVLLANLWERCSRA
jgi:hypothetical protein